ncbi:MAG: hypothetical protein LBM93_15010 [Oscillospiraceae bacterium]|jgi:hypothetical protein|nr:hypothetical protein [Oscillospiraceae bacterium]
MGSYAAISIGNYGFLLSKDSFRDLLRIYSPADRKTVKAESEDDYDKYLYITSVKEAK